MCVYFCGGSCVEDVTTHSMKHLSLHPTLHTCSADTILRAIEELTVDNTTDTSTSGKQYDRHNEQTVDQRLACNRTTNALIGVSWPTTISQVQEMSWNSTIFEVTRNVSSMTWTTDLVGIACQNRLCFLLMTTLIRNFYKAIMQRLNTKKVGLLTSSRIKTFVFKFISVPAKWVKTSRQHVLNIYTENYAYAKPFQTDFG